MPERVDLSRCLKTLVGMVVALTTVGVARPAAVGVGTEGASPRVAWTNIVPGNLMGQFIVARQPSVSAVEVYLVTGNRVGAGDTVTLALSTRDGRVLGLSAQRIATGFSGWRTFPLPGGGVRLTPGETYFLHLRDTGKVIFGWRYQANQEGHGQALFPADREPDSRFDFLFRLAG